MTRTGQVDLFTRRVKRVVPAREFNVHVMVADTLRRWLAPGWRFTHIASGEMRTERTGARLKRMGVVAGWPDFILLSPHRLAHFLELKRGSLALRDAQAEFAAYCQEHDYPFAVHCTFDGALDQLRTWGAVKVRISNG